MKTPLDILTAARNILADPTAWTKGEFAKGKSGRAVSPFGPYATCFCAIGALQRAAGRELAKADRKTSNSYVDARAVLEAETPRQIVTMFNDSPQTSHEDIIGVFNLAIATAQAAA